MTRNLTKKQIALLRELRRMASLESASFERIGPDAALPTTEAQVTAFIRERTRLHRETWILPIIDQLLRQGRRS